ncbi:MAG: ATP-binding protein [Thermodesulfobacteriota bacterium]
MPPSQKAHQPTRLLILLLALVLFGFFSIIASQLFIQRLSQKTARRAAVQHAQVHLAEHLEMLIKEIQADFFLLSTVNNRPEQEATKKRTLIKTDRALETLDLLEHGGSIIPPETISLLFNGTGDTLFAFTPEKNAALHDSIKDIKNLLVQIQKDLDRIDLLLVTHSAYISEKPLQNIGPLMAILNTEKDIFTRLRDQSDGFISTSQRLLEDIKQKSKIKIKNYHLIGFLIAGATFILVAFLGSRLILQIINTNNTLRITRANMASEYKRQKSLNSIFAITHASLTLKEKMARSLDLILQSLSSRSLGEGAIFLCDHNRQKITLQVQQGMSKKLKCMQQDSPFGSCLCSGVAVSGEIIECGSHDPRHRMDYAGMLRHNHYCMPIRVEDKTLAVLLIHLKNDILLPQSDKNFLDAVANSMAALIKQQMSEEKLAKSELDRLALFESSNEAILLLKNNEIIQCNKAAALLFGLKNQGEIISTSPTDLLAHYDEGASVQTFLSLITVAMQQGTAHSECLMTRKDRTTFEAALTFTPILLYGSNVLYLVVRDISGKKEEEHSLLIAKKHAEKASLAKSNFLAAMSHEIRTPLNAILGMTHLTLNKALDSELHENLETIHTAANSLMSLVNDILDITKIEEGQLLLEESPFSLQDITSKIKAIFSEQFRCANVAFKIRISDHTPLHLVGDELRITQILNNLLTNALKFTEQGEVVVTLSSPHHDKDNAVIQFMVQDSGIGISEDTLPIIFDEFTQGRASRQFGGLGLGLSISRRLADMMGGNLWATSTPHQGSTFYFEITLPRSSEQSVLSDEGHKETGFFPQAKALQGACVLVVEDNDINRKVVMQILETVGAIPEYARNGREAVAKITDHHQAVLMDIEMPILDGIQASREIRMNSGFADIPIIAMTAHAMVDDRRHCLEAGMNDYLTKPIEPLHFIDTLEKWLDPQSKSGLVHKKKGVVGDSDQRASSATEETIILDMATGIEKMGGNTSLYQEILADFLALHTDTASQIGKALVQGKNDEALATAHLLKGVASTLRAYDLQARAKEMEQMLRRGSADAEDIEKALGELTSSSKKLISRIKKAREDTEPAIS